MHPNPAFDYENKDIYCTKPTIKEFISFRFVISIISLTHLFETRVPMSQSLVHMS